MVLKKTLLKFAKIKTMAILIKLLVIKIVAKSLLGFFKRDFILLVFSNCSLLLFSISELLSEKKAISDPETNPKLKVKTLIKLFEKLLINP